MPGAPTFVSASGAINVVPTARHATKRQRFSGYRLIALSRSAQRLLSCTRSLHYCRGGTPASSPAGPAASRCRKEQSIMIMRIWHGWTRRKDADTYESMLRDEILPGIHRISGYLGAHLLRRNNGDDEVEFITITTWDTWDAIREFAGADGSASVIYPKAHDLLTRFDEYSEHYEGTWVP
jgi:heme-degrading monooxygenase HmoA